MKPEHYHALTERLQTTLESRSDVIALMALGSMAATERQPDAYSDHDFFVITTSGMQQQYRDTTDWLPYPEQLVLHFQETDHGCKAIYDDGHLLEYAIFDREELRVARINSYRVLFTKVNLDEVLASVNIVPQSVNPQKAYDTILSNILVGAWRAKRGEILSANTFIKQYALTTFVQMCWQQIAPDSPHRDSLDPMRRFEKQFPQLAKDIDKTIQLPVLEAAQSLLRLCDLFLTPTMPKPRTKAIAVISQQIS
ncbi:MAG: hypothetical protein WBC91_02485 [Phototrophicaceae bacterium]